MDNLRPVTPSPKPKIPFFPAKWGLLDLFLVLGIGGLVVAIVAPNFVRPRAISGRYRACLPNLKQIQGAVEQWALENRISPTNTYTLTDPAVLSYFKGSLLPKCPLGGRYSPGTNVADTPKCSHPGHTL